MSLEEVLVPTSAAKLITLLYASDSILQERHDKSKYHCGRLGNYQAFVGPEHRCHFVMCDDVKDVLGELHFTSPR